MTVPLSLSSPPPPPTPPSSPPPPRRCFYYYYSHIRLHIIPDLAHSPCSYRGNPSRNLFPHPFFYKSQVSAPYSIPCSTRNSNILILTIKLTFSKPRFCSYLESLPFPGCLNFISQPQQAEVYHQQRMANCMPS